MRLPQSVSRGTVGRASCRSREVSDLRSIRLGISGQLGAKCRKFRPLLWRSSPEMRSHYQGATFAPYQGLAFALPLSGRSPLANSFQKFYGIYNIFQYV